MNKNFLIMGGSGFVGTRLIDILSNSQYQVQNLDKKNSIKHANITTIGDIRELESLENTLEDVDTVVLLAAEHKDDVNPVSLYYDVNVQGTKNVLEAMSLHNIKKLIFTSSVAIYGLNKRNPDENHPSDPFNHYGKSKLLAEKEIIKWQQEDPQRSAVIIRPTVIFGENNRGNVFNLLKQIASGRFLMIGNGNNKKSMAYVGNVVVFIKFNLESITPGIHIYNYVDKPDLTMNELVSQVESSLNKKIPPTHLPYWLGMLGGYTFDVVSKLAGKKFPISSVRVKKFCATTQFDATKAHSTGFKAPFTLSEGLDRTLKFEFLEKE